MFKELNVYRDINFCKFKEWFLIFIKEIDIKYGLWVRQIWKIYS